MDFIAVCRRHVKWTRVNGTYSTAKSKQGACSGHGGIKTWLADAGWWRQGRDEGGCEVDREGRDKRRQGDSGCRESRWQGDEGRIGGNREGHGNWCREGRNRDKERNENGREGNG